MYEIKDSKPFETDEASFDTVLASDISFSGTIRFKKPFMIKGRVSGRIEAASDLLVDSDAQVNADIDTERVVVRGKVVGNVSGKKLVYLASTSSVTGDIASSKVVIEAGAFFTGHGSMSPRDQQKEEGV